MKLIQIVNIEQIDKKEGTINEIFSVLVKQMFFRYVNISILVRCRCSFIKKVTKSFIIRF
jgi:hypothetical protein